MRNEWKGGRGLMDGCCWGFEKSRGRGARWFGINLFFSLFLRVGEIRIRMRVEYSGSVKEVRVLM